MGRPSDREIGKKLAEAARAALSGRYRLVEPDPILVDLLNLGLLVNDLNRILPEIIREIKPRNYGGGHPPQKSYERPILNCELFAFMWDSARLGCRMYFKFALKEEVLWIVSLHMSRGRRGA
jgi:hypothetical protein